MELNIICKDFISNNHYLDYKVAYKGKKPYVLAFSSESTNLFKQQFLPYVKKEIKNQKWITPEKGKLIFVESVFYLPRIDMDCSNYWKVLLDALTLAGVWHDDNVVMEKVNRIYYDSKNPRIELKIYESQFLGIFDGEDHFRQFLQENCDKCKKTKEKCGVYKMCLSNRISMDYSLEKNICKKIKKVL